MTELSSPLGAVVSTGAPRRAWWRVLLRAPRQRLVRRLRRRVGFVAVLAMTALAVVAATMFLIDGWTAGSIPGWSRAVSNAAKEVGRAGKSELFLVPAGVCVLVAAFLAARQTGRFASGLFAIVAVRFSYLFAAVAVPGLINLAVKMIVGRARPNSGGAVSAFVFSPPAIKASFLSFPSGHSATTFAIAVAISSLWPRLAILVWPYAIAVSLSRVLSVAHHPSDVIAGALVGLVGALMVRRWFAVRGLVFTISRDGAIAPKPTPGIARLRRSLEKTP